MFAKTTRHYTIFTDSLCKSTKKKGIHKRNDAKSESPGTDPNFFHNTHQDDLAYFIAGLILVKTGAMYGLNSQFPASN